MTGGSRMSIFIEPNQQPPATRRGLRRRHVPLGATGCLSASAAKRGPFPFPDEGKRGILTAMEFDVIIEPPSSHPPLKADRTRRLFALMSRLGISGPRVAG